MSSQLTSDECKRIQSANNSAESYQMVTDMHGSCAVLDDWTSSGEDRGLPLDVPDSQTEVINSDLIAAGSTSHLKMLPNLEAMSEPLEKERRKKRKMEMLSEHRGKLECHLRRLSEETAILKKKSEGLLAEKNGEVKRLLKELGDSRWENTTLLKELEALRKDNIELVRDGNTMRRELKQERKKFDEMLKDEHSEVKTMRLKLGEEREKQAQLRIGNCEMKRMRRELADCQCENTKMRKELEAVLKANVEMLMLRRVNNNVELAPERKEIDELLKKKDSELEVMRLEVEKGRLEYLQLEMELKCMKKTTEKDEAERKKADEMMVRDADRILSDANKGYNTLKIETLVYEMEESDAIETITAVESSQTGRDVQVRLDKDKLAEAVTLMSSLESANRDLMEWTKEASLRILRENEEIRYEESIDIEVPKDKEESGETKDEEERENTEDKEDTDGKKDKEEGEETEDTEVREESMEMVDEEATGETPVNGHDEVLQEVKEVLVVDLGPSPLILEVDEEMEYREIVSTEETEDRKDTVETINFINGHDEAVQEVTEVIVVDDDDSMPEIVKVFRHPRVLFPTGEIPPEETAPVTEEKEKERIRPTRNGYATQVFKEHIDAFKDVNHGLGVKRKQMHNNKVNASALPPPSSRVVKAKSRGAAKSRKLK